MLSKIRFFLKKEVDADLFSLFYSLFNLIYNIPLFIFAAKNLDFHSYGGYASFIGLFLAQISFVYIFLTVFSFIPSLLKIISSILFLSNSVALYFVCEYNAVLDKTMMGNVFNTNTGEAGELIGYKFFIYIFFLGIIPSLSVLALNIKKTSVIRKIYLLISIVLAISVFAYLNSKTWLWFDKNSKKIGGLTMPFSYIGNTMRYFSEKAALNKVPVKLPDASFENKDKTTVILVIGESARSSNFSLYGYPRITNAYLKNDSVVALPNARSLSTYTTESVAFMLSHLGSQKTKIFYEPLPSYLQRQGINVFWFSNNWGEPKLDVSYYKKASKLREECGAACGNQNYDSLMIRGLKEELNKNQSSDNFMVFHLTGSHGPLYSSKYPAEFEVFKPACKSVDLQKCSSQELINAYDNTILYTDYFLHEVISFLRSIKKMSSVMIYISDHGESLGEYGFYLHGAPYSMAPDFQKNIPFIVWMSDEFKKRRKISDSDFKEIKNLSQDNIFHSVMGAFLMKSPVYEKSKDIFAKR
ncbi:MAG: phosphoethanolamine--lipid A transferase EptA [Elusimicrobia bacterium]|nr:phosphoethanolamine--lipid A transferase EptA [Elusimicrobiota bacterium]